MNHLFDNLADHSIELIQNPPLHEMSFDLPIRPASSSPSEENAPAENRAKETARTKTFNVPATEETPIYSEMRNDTKLKELKEDVNKFIAVLEADMASLNANDVSLNLSDVTYQGNVNQ